MFKVSSSEKFKRDLKIFEQAIEKIANPKKKDEYQKILDKLISNFKLIEEGHDASFNTVINPALLREHFLETIELRRILEKLVKDSKL